MNKVGGLNRGAIARVALSENHGKVLTLTTLVFYKIHFIIYLHLILLLINLLITNGMGT